VNLFCCCFIVVKRGKASLIEDEVVKAGMASGGLSSLVEVWGWD
jgi:hypothetical protein